MALSGQIKIISYKGDSFNYEGLVVTITGSPVKGDSFIISSSTNLSSSLKFNLKSGSEFAASAFKLAESSTKNLGTGELSIVGTYKEPASSIPKIEDIFRNSDNSLLGTTFLKDGAVASIGRNIDKISH